MTFNVLVKPSNHSFTIDSNETILEAGLRHGFIFPYSCRDGVCGTCKGMILQGTVDYGEYEGDTLNESPNETGNNENSSTQNNNSQDQPEEIVEEQTSYTNRIQMPD